MRNFIFYLSLCLYLSSCSKEQKLFKIIEKKPKKFIINKSIDNNKYRAISDYISGMTDRYAIQLYKSHK